MRISFESVASFFSATTLGLIMFGPIALLLAAIFAVFSLVEKIIVRRAEKAYQPDYEAVVAEVIKKGKVRYAS